jgi:hypothetical protein
MRERPNRTVSKAFKAVAGGGYIESDQLFLAQTFRRECSYRHSLACVVTQKVTQEVYNMSASGTSVFAIVNVWTFEDRWKP